MKDPNFPPRLNDNYEGLDPIAGFDFEVFYKGESIGKFQRMKMSVSDSVYILPKIKWELIEGLLNFKVFELIFDIKKVVGTQNITSDNKIVIKFEASKSDNNKQIKGFYELETTISSINLGVMPGKKVAVIKLEGETTVMNFKPS